LGLEKRPLPRKVWLGIPPRMAGLGLPIPGRGRLLPGKGTEGSGIGAWGKLRNWVGSWKKVGGSKGLRDRRGLFVPQGPVPFLSRALGGPYSGEGSH